MVGRESGKHSAIQYSNTSSAVWTTSGIAMLLSSGPSCLILYCFAAIMQGFMHDPDLLASHCAWETSKQISNAVIIGPCHHNQCPGDALPMSRDRFSMVV